MTRIFSHFVSLRALAVLIVAAGLWSCAQVPASRPAPDFALSNFPPMVVNASAVEVIDRYNPAADSSDISTTFAIPPVEAVKVYGNGRLRAQGANDRLEFIIENASVRHKLRQPDSSVQRWMGVNRREEYEILVSVRLSLRDNAGIERRGTVITARRSLDIPESYSLATREEKQAQALLELIRDLDRAAVNAVYNTLGLSVSRSPEAR